MKNRRSIRKYTDQGIPESSLNGLLKMATRTSNTGNMQLYSVVVTRDPTNKEKLAPVHSNQPMIAGAPVVLTFRADANRFVEQAECRKAEAGFDNLRTFIALTIDVMLFTQSSYDAAEEKGLGTYYLGAAAYNADRTIETFSLPRLIVPIVTVAVGYPVEPIPAQVEHLPLATVIQNEIYTNFTPASIDALYGEKEALEINKQFVRKNNKETLAQVFMDIRYTKRNSGHFSEVLLKILKQQGFMR